jgi:hypothetical protein
MKTVKEYEIVKREFRGESFYDVYLTTQGVRRLQANAMSPRLIKEFFGIDV